MNAGRLTSLAAGLCLLALATAAPASAQIAIASATPAAGATTPSPTFTSAASAPTPTSTAGAAATTSTPSATATPAAAARAGFVPSKPTATPTPTRTPVPCRLMDTPDSASFALQLTGQDTWVDGTLGETAVGNICPGGWGIDASTSAFRSGSRALPADALRVSGVAVQVLGGSAPVNDLAYPITLTADAAPARIFRATGASGIGAFRLVPSVRLHVPADAYAGSYSGSVTLTLVAGP